MNEIIISSQKEYDHAVKTGGHFNKKIVIRNTKEFIIVHTDVEVGEEGQCKKPAGGPPIVITAKENAVAAADGKNTTIIGFNSANIIAKGNCKVILNDFASGNCIGHCDITLKGSSKISADGNCTIHAFDEAAVSASGSSKVYTYQKATAKGTDITSLSGRGESTLYGYKSCKITAKDNCIVYAGDQCTVQAADNCLIVAKKNTKIVSKDNYLVMSKENLNILLHDQCRHINLDGVNDKNIMNTLEQMALTKAVVERPYVAVQILKDNIPPQRKESVNRRLNTMGLKDQVSIKNHLFSLIEAEPSVKNQPPAQNIERQLEAAHKAGYVQGVCECAAVVGSEQNLGKKLLSEMNVTKDMAQKFANPETYKKLEQGIFARKQEQTNEQTQGLRR